MDLSLPTITGGADAVLNELRRSPPGTVNFADQYSVTGRLVYIMGERAKRYAAEQLQPELRNALAVHVAINGTRPEIPPPADKTNITAAERAAITAADEARGDWDAALDDAVEALLLQSVDYVSQSFLGQYGIDTMLHEGDKAIERIANAFGREVWDHYRYEFTDANGNPLLNDMVEAIGVYPSTVKPATIVPPTKEEVKADMDNTMRRLHAALEARGTFDPNAMAEELELASSNDDVLAMSAIMRLGGTFDEDVTNLRLHRAVYGGSPEVMRELALAIEAYDEPGTPPPSPAPVAAPTAPQAAPVASVGAPPPPEAPKAPKARKVPPQPEGALDGRALAILRKYSGLRDQDLADKLGVSRSTWGNYEKGKAWLVPTEDQRKYFAVVVKDVLDQMTWAKQSLGV